MKNKGVIQQMQESEPAEIASRNPVADELADAIFSTEPMGGDRGMLIGTSFGLAYVGISEEVPVFRVDDRDATPEEVVIIKARLKELFG